jgi:hypothetical protein
MGYKDAPPIRYRGPSISETIMEANANMLGYLTTPGFLKALYAGNAVSSHEPPSKPDDIQSSPRPELTPDNASSYGTPAPSTTSASDNPL